MDRDKLALIRDIINELRDVTKCQDDFSKAYILPTDAQRLWADRTRISTVLNLRSTSALVRIIYDEMTTLLTILVFSNATLCLENFRKHFFRNNRPKLTDRNLPLKASQVDFLEAEPALIDRFLENQYRFCPYVIEISDQEVTTIDQKYRLPFEEDPQVIGSGFHGEVAIVPISPGYLKQQNGTVWTKVCRIDSTLDIVTNTE